jgi:hypothetical protein
VSQRLAAGGVLCLINGTNRAINDLADEDASCVYVTLALNGHGISGMTRVHCLYSFISAVHMVLGSNGYC